MSVIYELKVRLCHGFISFSLETQLKFTPVSLRVLIPDRRIRSEPFSLQTVVSDVSVSFSYLYSSADDGPV